MKVNDWFKNGCNYQQGVLIYAGLKKSKPNLIRLFRLKENAYNTQKLKNELTKFKEVQIEQTFISEVTTKTSAKPTPAQNQTTTTYKPLLINQLPVELHPVFIQQKQDFATACSLKIQLNNLTPEAEDEALKLCIEIESLFDKIEAAWKILDHYQETKEILQLQDNSFSNLTPAQLLQRRNQKRSTLSKTKSKIKQLNASLLKAETKALKTKIETTIARAKEKEINLQVDIQKLTDLINGK